MSTAEQRVRRYVNAVGGAVVVVFPRPGRVYVTVHLPHRDFVVATSRISEESAFRFLAPVVIPEDDPTEQGAY